jgi:hypothetical protein
MKTDIAPYSYHETGKDQLETGEVKYMILWYDTPRPPKGGFIQNGKS